MLSVIWIAGSRGCYVLTHIKLMVREGVSWYSFLKRYLKVLGVENKKT